MRAMDWSPRHCLRKPSRSRGTRRERRRVTVSEQREERARQASAPAAAGQRPPPTWWPRGAGGSASGHREAPASPPPLPRRASARDKLPAQTREHDCGLLVKVATMTKGVHYVVLARETTWCKWDWEIS